MNKQYFNHTPLPESNPNQLAHLAVEVEAAFLEVEKDLAIETKNASLGSTIGNLDTWYLKQYPEESDQIIGYEQELHFPENSKEASLDIIPATNIGDLNTAAIKNKLNASQIYRYKHDNILEEDTDFCFIGRKVVLGKRPPSNSLSITYSGVQPTDNLDEPLNLKYNVLQYEDLETKEIINTFTPTKTTVGYTISGFNFLNMCSKHINTIIRNRPYDLHKYVIIYDSRTEEVLSVDNLSINKTSITFETEDYVPNTVKIYVANSSISHLIEGLYRLFYAHDHGTEGGKNVTHNQTLGLFTNTEKIHYQTTKKANYDHPQYLNREGFIDAPEVYNNAMLGDLLISSKDKSNAYNNLYENSFKLVFGEYTSGHNLSYNKEGDVLVLDSLSRDGLKIVSPKNKNILQLNEHSISDTIDGEYSGVRVGLVPTNIEGEEFAVFSIKKSVNTDEGVQYLDEAEIQVFGSTFSITVIKDTLNIIDKATLAFGSDPNTQIKCSFSDESLQIVSDNTLANILLTVTLDASKINVKELNAKAINIHDDQVIYFGLNQYEALAYSTDKSELAFTLNKPLKFVKNGYDSGIQLGGTVGARLFASTDTGYHTENQSERLSLYVETQGDVVLLTTPDSSSTPTQNLKTRDMSNIYFKDSYQNNVRINYNAGATNGISLNGETDKIFVQKDNIGNIGTMLQSAGGLSILQSYSVSDYNVSMNYGTIRAAEFRMEGTSPSAGYYGNVMIPAGNTLQVDGEASFYSDLNINTNLTVKGVANLNTLETSTVNTNTVVASTGITTTLLSAPVGFDSNLYIGSDTIFNGSSNFKQAVTFVSNATFESNIYARDVTTQYLTVTNLVDFNSLSAKDISTKDLTVDNLNQVLTNGDVRFAARVKYARGADFDRDATITLGSSDITNTRNTSGVMITENSIKMGNNSNVRTTKVFANKGAPTGGNSDNIGGYAFETANGGQDGDTGLFCTDKGSTAFNDDLVFYINGEKVAEVRKEPLNFSGSIAGKEKVLVTAEAIKDQFNNLNGDVLGMVYPIGSVYMNANDNRNPKEILKWSSSVWARMAVGMTLVGAEGTSNGEKMAASWDKPSNISLAIESTFGAFVHELEEEELPAMKLPLRLEDHYAGDDTTGSGVLGLANRRFKGTPITVEKAHAELAGKNKPHNNTQPSVVVAIWRRIG